MDEAFFKALTCSLLGSDPDPSIQTATADLARDICAALSRSLRKMPKPSEISSSVYRSFEALTRHLVLPLLVAVSSPGLDSLVPSSAWALTYLLRATDSLRNQSPTPEPSLCRWPQRLMLLEHLLDALEVQFRCLSRLTHSLRRPNNSTSAEDVEDLNFDALFPLFSLLAQSPLDLTLRETTCTRLHSILKQFIDFLTAFTVYLPTKSGAGFFYHCLKTLLDSTLLPVSHQFLCALHHTTSHDRGCIVTPDLLTHLGALAEALSDLGASSSAQAHITACLTDIFAVFCLSSSAPWQATMSAGERHGLFVDFLFTLLVTLKRRVCWSQYCSDLLALLIKTLQSSFPLSLDEQTLSTLLEQCLLTVRGPASKEVCLALVSLLSSQQETRISFGVLAGTLDWLDSIIRLYILPVGVPVLDNPGVWDQFHKVLTSGEQSIGRNGLVQHEINTGTATSQRQPPRRIRIHYKTELSNIISGLLTQDIIEPSNSPWAAPVTLVKKKEGHTWLCIDYRQMNKVTVHDPFPIPSIDDIIDAVAGAPWFASLYLSQSYWKIDVRPEDLHKTASILPTGLFQFNTLLLGLANATATCQRLIQLVL
nr:unnamed protein product [Spirometra erinaceieuropaei]